MKLIMHRRNSVSDLKATDQKYGVEVDIRSYGGELIVHHDPFVGGESFETWIKEYKHQLLILNVKEEGLEAKLISLMSWHGIKDYFFLDQSFPFLIKWAFAGVRQCAVRVSEFESIDTALALKGRLEWVWVDCFTEFPISKQESQRLIGAGFKLCLVSPELQGREAQSEIPALVKLLEEREIKPEAVCTKCPDLWEESVGN